MRKPYRRLLDLALVLAGIAILLVLLQAPPVTTPELPGDDIHRPFLALAIKQGKKAAESSCRNCHNPVDRPFSAGHPTGDRCLFCHRLPAKKPGATAPGH